MTENNKELLKYPVMGLSLILVLWLARCTLGVDFSRLQEAGPGGLRFAEKQSEVVLDQEGRLREAEASVEILREQLAKLIGTLDSAGVAAPRLDTGRFATSVDSAAQFVSDQATAIVQSAREEGSEPLQSLRGFIWIGNFRDGWGSRTIVSPETGERVQTAPGQIEPNNRFIVTGNMVLRDFLPPNNQEYFRARRKLGVIPRGTTIRIVSTPEGIDRGFAVQWWAEVEVVP